MQKDTKVPGAILTAAAGMLAPFGVDLVEVLNSRNKKQMDERYLSVADVEAKYGLKRWTLHRLIKAGKIAAAKVSAAKSGKVLVEVASLEHFLRSGKQGKEEKG